MAGIKAGGAEAKAGKSPTMAEQVAFINAINPDGTITSKSFWNFSDDAAQKWGSSKAGVGATLRYIFDPDSNLTAQEEGAVRRALTLWASVADLEFIETTVEDEADFGLLRGSDGKAFAVGNHSKASGAKLGVYKPGEAAISIDSSTPGFELNGDLDLNSGYGFSTIVHEVGHILGLGHSGPYNFDAKAKTDQFSAFDDGMYTVMSYLSWENADAKFAAQNPVKGTDWGANGDGVSRTAPHTMMQLDIIAIQQLYGAARTTPFSGGQTYGFRSNIKGTLGELYDFTKNEAPVVTLYNQGRDNTLDLSGFKANAAVDLRPGAFSSAGGLVNNIAIAQGTEIANAVGGRGDDRISGGNGANMLRGWSGADVLNGRGGNDRLEGGSGADTFVFATRLDANVDAVLDFKGGDDGFRLFDKYFRGLKEGVLDGYRLKEIASAEATSGVDRSDRILYDKDEGGLYFDRDGSGGRYERVKFAELRDGTAIAADDFLIV